MVLYQHVQYPLLTKANQMLLLALHAHWYPNMTGPRATVASIWHM